MERRALPGAAFTLLLGLAACMAGEGPVPVACGSVPPADPDLLADTLAVTLVLAERPSRPTHVLVRVDPLSEPGAVLFSGTAPESAAAVSASLTPDAVFHGCVSERADGFRLRAEKAPIGRVWVRVSSNRPVAVRLVTEASEAGGPGSLREGAGAADDADEGGALVVAPGASGRRAWSFEAPPGSRE